jgi:hypothetical protein
VTCSRSTGEYLVSVHGLDEGQNIPYPADMNPELDAAMQGRTTRDFYADLWPVPSPILNIDTKTPVTAGPGVFDP